MNKNNKPLFFLILKIIGFIGIIIAILGFYFIFTGFGDFESNNFMIGMFIIPLGIIIGVPCLINGFHPEITKANIKSTKYIQEDNKEDLKDIADNAADITSDAITKTATAIKNGVKSTKFCKHCGAEIDSDSRFCCKCGKEQ